LVINRVRVLGSGPHTPVDLDDFQNVCGQGKYSLLNAVDKALNSDGVLPTTQAPPATTKPTDTPTDKHTDKPTNPLTQRPATKTNAPCQTAKPTTAPTPTPLFTG